MKISKISIFRNDSIISSVYGNGKILYVIKKQDKEYFSTQFENGVVTIITREDIQYLIDDGKKIEINA